jgi:hypothetical protein
VIAQAFRLVGGVAGPRRRKAVRAEQAQRRVDQRIRLKVLPGARRAVIVRRPDRSSSRRPHEAGRDDP